MRIIPLLLVAAGAATMVAASPARSQPASAGWKSGPGLGRSHDFRRGPGRHDGRRGRHHRRFANGGFVAPFAATGLFDAYDAPDPHGTGFFAGSGGQVRMEGGRPYYDYDRSYPYEWASAAAAPAGWVWEVTDAGALERCADEHGVRVCRGRR